MKKRIVVAVTALGLLGIPGIVASNDAGYEMAGSKRKCNNRCGVNVEVSKNRIIDHNKIDVDL